MNCRVVREGFNESLPEMYCKDSIIIMQIIILDFVQFYLYQAESCVIQMTANHLRQSAYATDPRLFRRGSASGPIFN